MSRLGRGRQIAQRAVRNGLRRAGIELLRVEQVEQLRRQRAALLRAAVEGDRRHFTATKPVAGVVFSKDRPLQLEGLLRSYFLHSIHPAPVTVLFRAGTAALAEAYDEVSRLYVDRGVAFVAEQRFRPDLVRTLEALDASRVFFLVDDILFLRPVDFAEVARIDPRQELLSLRLAPTLRYCYAHDRPLVSPPTLQRTEWGYAWQWQDGELDWAYPQSVDGNVFDTAEMTCLARALEYKAPNTFELALGSFADLLGARRGLCYSEPRIVNIPANRVQDEVANRSSEITVESLLERWRSGYRLDAESYAGVSTVGVHQELPLRFRRRDG